MLPKERRIKKVDYPLSKSNKVERGRFVLIFIYPLGNKANSRFSVTVSKKVAKTAVERNKLRRLAYKTIQNHLSFVKKGFLFKISIIEVPKADQISVFEAEITRILKKVDIIDNT